MRTQQLRAVKNGCFSTNSVELYQIAFGSGLEGFRTGTSDAMILQYFRN